MPPHRFENVGTPPRTARSMYERKGLLFKTNFSLKYNKIMTLIRKKTELEIPQKIKALKPDSAVLCAIWMQTYDGLDWLADNEDNQNAELTHNFADV